MARTAIAVNTLPGVAVAGLADPAGTAIDQANGMNVALASGAIPANPTAHMLFLRVANTVAGAQTVTIRAGVNPPAFRAPIGDLVVSIPATSTKWIGPLEAGRFMQNDNSINVDFQAGTTGTITAFASPGHTL